MHVSARERRILETLLQNDTSVSIDQLSIMLEVSGRTIHRDLKNIEELLVGYGLSLYRQQGNGLKVKGATDDRRKLKDDLSKVKYTDFSPDERLTIILLILLEKNEPIKLYFLAKKLFVTEATISNDLDFIQKRLEDVNLQLIRRRGYGIKIDGAESEKRRLISTLIKNHVTDIDIFSMLNPNEEIIDKRDSLTISDRLLGLINPKKLQLIEREVEKLKKNLTYGIADSAYVGLVVHLALVVQRLEQGEEIKINVDNLDRIIDTKEYEIAEKMVDQLEKTLELTIPRAEISYIAMHILGAKLQVDHNYLMNDASLGIASQAKKLIAHVGEVYGKDLTSNYGLLNGLVAHLKPALFRLNKNMQITNPIITEIKQNYNDLFEIVKKSVEKAFPGTEFPETEIGFLVLHFGAVLLEVDVKLELNVLVICPSGIGTARLLGEKLLQKIPEIKEVKNISYFDLKDERVNGYDLIITTIPIEGYEDAILASPILTLKDVQNIKQVVNRKKISGHKFKTESDVTSKKLITENLITRLESTKNYSSLILRLLDSFYVGEVNNYSFVEEVVLDICHQLHKKQLIENESQVVKDLLERQKSGGLGIPETSLALFHARSKGAKEISFTIFTLPETILLNGMDENEMYVKQILLMVSPLNPRNEANEILSYLSSLLIKDQESINLFEKAIESDVYNYLSKQYHLFLDDKLS